LKTPICVSNWRPSARTRFRVRFPKTVSPLTDLNVAQCAFRNATLRSVGRCPDLRWRMREMKSRVPATPAQPAMGAMHVTTVVSPLLYQSARPARPACARTELRIENDPIISDGVVGHVRHEPKRDIVVSTASHPGIVLVVSTASHPSVLNTNNDIRSCVPCACVHGAALCGSCSASHPGFRPSGGNPSEGWRRCAQSGRRTFWMANASPQLLAPLKHDDALKE